MSGSIWNPASDNPLPPSGHPKTQRFVATEGQVLFNLSAFTYTLGTGSLVVYVSGVPQIATYGFSETSTSSFTLSEACEANDIVVAMGY